MIWIIALCALLNYGISAHMIAAGTYTTFWFARDVLYALALLWLWSERPR